MVTFIFYENKAISQKLWFTGPRYTNLFIESIHGITGYAL